MFSDQGLLTDQKTSDSTDVPSLVTIEPTTGSSKDSVRFPSPLRLSFKKLDISRYIRRRILLADHITRITESTTASGTLKTGSASVTAI